jgi:hypothetical protein
MTSREFVISSVRLTEGPLPQPSGDRLAGREIRSEEEASPDPHPAPEIGMKSTGRHMMVVGASMAHSRSSRYSP